MRLLRPLALLLVLLPRLVASAGEPQWIEVRSEHFSVITDSGENEGRHVATLFEQMRAAFGIMFVRTKINQSVPLQIIAFRSTKELRQSSPLFNGKVVELGGFFQPGEDKNFILVDMSQEENWQIVFHEYAHLLLNSNFPPTAPWFDEGFAEYLSTMKVSHNGTIEIGNLLPGAELLDRASKFRLLDLFQVQHHSETYSRKGERREMFYVQSWLVAHYLFDTNRLSQAARYFVLTNQKKMPIPEAVQEAFGMSLPEMEKTIWSNWHAGKLPIRRFKEKITTMFSATVRPLDPVEVRCQMADFHEHTLDYGDKGVQEYEDILRSSPNLPAAQRGLGYAYLRKRDFAKAAQHFQAAATLGSTDPRVYFYSAVLVQQTDPGAVGSDEFMQNLRRAIQLDPQYADAYQLLAFGMAGKGNFAEAGQSLRYAIELSPRNETLKFNLALMLLNQRKYQEATAMLQALTQSANGMLAQKAEATLAKISDAEALFSRTVTHQNDTIPVPTSKPNTDAASAMPKDSEPTVLPDLDNRPVAFISGKIVSVDCSVAPSAVVTMASSGKSYRFHVADREKLVLINTNKFSCDWKNVLAHANYRDSGDLQGDLISLELP